MIKTKIRRILSQPIWSYFRYYKYKFVNKGYFALNGLDRKMFKYLDYQNGYFVELGANDGFTQSNTLALENKKGWRGVLIEPSPHLFLSCIHFREKEGNSIHCCACVPFDYDEKFVEIDYANLMSISVSLNSDIGDVEAFRHSRESHQDDSARRFQFGANARTLTSVLDASGSPNNIDFMSLDVEGAELAVLSGLDFGRYKVRYILVECRSISELKKFFEPLGYRCIDKLSHHDYLFSRMEDRTPEVDHTL